MTHDEDGLAHSVALEIDVAPTRSEMERVEKIRNLARLGRHQQCVDACVAALGELRTANAILQVAVLLHNYGLFADASRALEPLLPKLYYNPIAFLIQSRCLLNLGEYDRALEASTRAVELDKTSADARAALAASLVHVGRSDEAVPILRALVDAAPDRVVALCEAAMILSGSLQTNWAEEFYLEAIRESHEKLRQPLVALAQHYLAQGRYDEALVLFDKACALDADPRTHFERASLLSSLRRFEDAVAGYKEVLEADPHNGSAHVNIGAISCDLGRQVESQKHFALAIRHGGPHSNAYRFKAALSMPSVYESEEQIDEVRANLEQDLELIAKSGPVSDPLGQIGAANFFLTYHGKNNLALQRKIAETHLAVHPTLDQPMSSPRQQRDRIRIGIFSQCLYGHTVGQVSEGMIKHVRKDRFEVILFRPPSIYDSVSKRIDESVEKVVPLPQSLEYCRKAIASEELDILYYLDIGMTPLSYFLGFSRLAPVQITGWGHPDTSGLPNMDYYISSQAFEPDGAQDHYSETLVQLPTINVCLEPRPPTAPGTRAEFGLPEGVPLLSCPQTIYKFHPAFDQSLFEILRKDPNVVILISEYVYKEWNDRLHERLAKGPAGLSSRIKYMPRVDPSRFPAYLGLMDGLLDPRHFTGGFTSYLALNEGVPIITWKGDLMRGRMTYGFYKQMGFTDLAAATSEEYSDLALRLIQDRDWSVHVREEVARRSGAIFGDLTGVRAFEDFLTSVYEQGHAPHAYVR